MLEDWLTGYLPTTLIKILLLLKLCINILIIYAKRSTPFLSTLVNDDEASDGSHPMN